MALMGVKLLRTRKNEAPYLKSYRVRPQFIQAKRILILIALLLFFTFLISINANSHLKADVAPTVRPKEPINSVAIRNNKTNNQDSTKESLCQSTNPKYGGYISKNCTETRYDKVIECFASSEDLENVNIEYSLINNIRENEGVKYREGEIEIADKNKFRILATFRSTNCLIDLISASSDKDYLQKIFSIISDPTTSKD